MGFTPKYAVHAARDWMHNREAVLRPACADPHKDVPPEHLKSHGKVGVKVFSPTNPDEHTLTTEAMAFRQAIARNPSFCLTSHVVPVPPREREGETIEATRLMRSFIVLAPNKTKIVIIDQKNECWHRFLCAKEIAHILTFGEGTRVDDVEKQLVLAFQIGDVADWDAEVSREQFANIFAVEMVLPLWHRDCLHNLLDNGTDLQVIAQHFRVPRKVIDMYAGTSYRAKSQEIIARGSFR